MIFWVGNDNLVRVLNLVSQLGGDDAALVPVTSATITGQIKDTAGANVGSAITLSYVAGSDSDYEGLVSDVTALTDGTAYTLEVTADDGTDRLAFWVIEVLALARRVA